MFGLAVSILAFWNMYEEKPIRQKHILYWSANFENLTTSLQSQFEYKVLHSFPKLVDGWVSSFFFSKVERKLNLSTILQLIYFSKNSHDHISLYETQFLKCVQTQFYKKNSHKQIEWNQFQSHLSTYLLCFL